MQPRFNKDAAEEQREAPGVETVFSKQDKMMRAISIFINKPETSQLSLDEIYGTSMTMPESVDYMNIDGLGISPTRRYLVRNHIANAIRAWIDMKGKNDVL